MDPISLWIILVDFSKGHRASIRFSDPSFREGIFEGWRSRGIKGDVDRGGGGRTTGGFDTRFLLGGSFDCWKDYFLGEKIFRQITSRYHLDTSSV